MLINGRYLAASPSGVQRVASALLQAVDRGIAPSDAERWRLLRPPSARPEQLDSIAQSQVGRRGGQLWEQLELPLAAKGQGLLNLCNTAPILHPRNVVMIHDAQVFTSPASYSRVFVAWYRRLLPTIGRRAARVLTVSEFSKRQLAEFGVAKEENILVVPNGGDHLGHILPDDAKVIEHGLDRSPYVLALSSLQAHKNIRVLLDAVPALRSLNVKLVLAGRADAHAFAQAGLNVAEEVVFTGPVSDRELLGLMRHALAFALPSLTEGFGLPALEAMNCQCPVIAAPAGALPEVCGEAVLYADLNQAEAWADAVRRLVEDGELRARLSATGEARARLFTWERSAKQLLKGLEDLG